MYFLLSDAAFSVKIGVGDEMKVIVVGGGPSGIFSAIAIRKFHPDFEVLLLEKDADIASRLKVAGNGRCNFTHRELDKEAYSSLFVLPYLVYSKEILSFLEENGFGYYFDEEGRGYPVSESAQSLIRTLKDLLAFYRVETRTSCAVDSIEIGEKLRINGIECDRLILAVGGISAQNERLNYNRIIDQIGVKRTALSPSLTPISTSSFPLTWENKRVKCQASLYYRNALLHRERGEVLFKKNGLSGIVIFNLSAILARKHLTRYDDYSISLNLLPDFSDEEVRRMIRRNPKLDHIFIPPLAEYLTKSSDPFESIRNLKFSVRGLYDFGHSQVTSGGVDLNQLRGDLSLKKEPRIYTIGEMIDIDGLSGGYNIGLCLCEGWAVGKEIK